MEQQVFQNRELSWLQFNERVLEEADRADVPLGEQLRFMSIYQTNLDEFFRVRLGTLYGQMQSGTEIRDNKTHMTPAEQMAAILLRVRYLEKKKDAVYRRLVRRLWEAGIRILELDKLSFEEKRRWLERFDRDVLPVLSPVIVGGDQPFPFLENGVRYLCAVLTGGQGQRRFGLVRAEGSDIPRWLETHEKGYSLVLTDQLMREGAAHLFPEHQVISAMTLRVIRNADIPAGKIYDEELSLRDMMVKLVKRRRRLAPVIMEYRGELDALAMAELGRQIGIDQEEIMVSRTPLDLTFLEEGRERLYQRRELFYHRQSPRMSPSLSMSGDLIDQIRKRDVLLSYPFESMRPFLELLRQAAEDSRVVSIYMTLYRVADHSKIVEALAAAAENGKDVLVLDEVRARFDEENNLAAARILEEAGCRVIFGPGRFKVHSKLCLIRKRTPEGIVRITQIGTGNYNEITARQYTDLCLMTADQDIGADAEKIFQALQREDLVEKTRTLLVSPLCLQLPLAELMEEQRRLALEGKPAYIGIKINALTDLKLMEQLIAASQAGVAIELIVRGICCLVPGIPGKTEHIRIVSVVGRFLEHSRIYRFGKGRGERVFIASADLMTRNTERRVEVAAPLKDSRIRDRVCRLFDLVFADNVNGRELLSDGEYHAREAAEPVNSQEILYRKAYEAQAAEEQTCTE